MKKILLSIAILGVVGALGIGATSAIFSDDEASTGNTFTAGAIDLTIDNESYYNGQLNEGTTWLQAANLDDGQGPGPDGSYLFFNFGDVKPGDYGEDTISLHVNDNSAWACVDVTLTSNDDNGLTEPEAGDGDSTDGVGEGELADAINFMWWADDGDNVYEDDETLLPAGPLGNLAVGQTVSISLADSETNIWEGTGPLEGGVTYYIGKAWCLGDMVADAVPQDGFGDQLDPTIDPGFNCDGAPVNNLTQTDSLSADIAFHAEQSRNNGQFLCEPLPVVPDITGNLTVTKIVEGGSLAVGDFPLSVSGEPVVSGVSEDFEADTLLTVSETDNTGLYVATIGGNCDPDGTITLTEDQVASCSVTNVYSPAEIMIDKVVQFSNQTLAVGVGDFDLFIDDGVNPPIQVTDEVLAGDLPAGTYTVSESYTGTESITYDAVFTGDCSDDGQTGTIVVGANGSASCTITNIISQDTV